MPCLKKIFFVCFTFKIILRMIIRNHKTKQKSRKGEIVHPQTKQKYNFYEKSNIIQEIVYRLKKIRFRDLGSEQSYSIFLQKIITINVLFEYLKTCNYSNKTFIKSNILKRFKFQNKSLGHQTSCINLKAYVHSCT